jgi:hypothetical protein
MYADQTTSDPAKFRAAYTSGDRLSYVVFIPEDERDRAALAKAMVVKAGDPRFAELDAKYLASRHNPLVIGHRQGPPGLAVTSP